MENWYIKNRQPKFDYKPLEDKVHPVIIRLLFNREFESLEEVLAYLKPDVEALPLPEEMYGVMEAGDLLLHAIDSGEKILIVGDYDVDGTMGTYILVELLRELGAEVDYRIPHRVEEGYGLQKIHVEEAQDSGVKVLVTVDNGIVAFEEIEYAKALGMYVVVTDHHEPLVENGEQLLPPADVIVNPKRKDQPYKLDEICGAYVAYKVAEFVALSVGVFREEFQARYLPYAALATVCDMMKLHGENRIVVKHGLEGFKHVENIGYQALKEATDLQTESLNVYQAGFVIGPTINAAGRLGDANDVVKLFLTDDEGEAEAIATKIHKLNRERIKMTDEAVDEAEQMMEEWDLSEFPIIVLYLSDIHESIAGIVAGKLKEKYGYPAIVFAGKEDVLKGSGRSISGVSLVNLLRNQRDFLVRYGGHDLAAGLSIELEKLPQFIENINREARDMDEDLFVPSYYAECPLPLYTINLPLAEAIDHLSPFGIGNPTPVFALKNVDVTGLQEMGKKGRAARLFLHDRSAKMEAVYFGAVEDFISYIESKYGKIAKEKLLKGDSTEVKLDILFKVQVNEFLGKRSAQIVITNYR